MDSKDEIDEINITLKNLERKIQENGPEKFTQSDKKQFWRAVGGIKRLQHPNEDVIESAAYIRETLHKYRFGKPISLKFVMFPLTIAAVLLILGKIIYMNDNDELLTSGLIIYLGYVVIFSVYSYVLKVTIYNEIITYLVIFSSSAIELFLFHNYWPGFLAWLIKLSIFGVVPMLYPHGRWLSSKITKIKIDGAIRDIYFLITLKTNYKSYLSVPQNNRHWFFIIPGIGTALTATIIGVFELIFYEVYSFLVLAMILIIAEIYSYVFDVGVWGGELGHARREKMIIRDIKKRKSQVN